MKCPICKKDLDSAINVVGKDGYLFHMAQHVKDITRMAFDLLEDTARRGKCNQYTVVRARRILKERQKIRKAIKGKNDG